MARSIRLRSVVDVVRTIEMDGIEKYKTSIVLFIRQNDGLTVETRDISEMLDLFDPDRKWVRKHGRFSRKGYNIVTRRLEKALLKLGEYYLVEKGLKLRKIINNLTGKSNNKFLKYEIVRRLKESLDLESDNEALVWAEEHDVFNSIIYQSSYTDLLMIDDHIIDKINVYNTSMGRKIVISFYSLFDKLEYSIK